MRTPCRCTLNCKILVPVHCTEQLASHPMYGALRYLLDKVWLESKFQFCLRRREDSIRYRYRIHCGINNNDCNTNCTSRIYYHRKMLAEYWYPVLHLVLFYFVYCSSLTFRAVPKTYCTVYLFDHMGCFVCVGCSPPQLLSQFSLQSRIQGEHIEQF